MTFITPATAAELDLCSNQTQMKPNMGSEDRVIRLILAAIVVGLYFSRTVTGTLGIVLMVFAAVFALTSFMGFCPLYTAVGFTTKKQ